MARSVRSPKPPPRAGIAWGAALALVAGAVWGCGGDERAPAPAGPPPAEALISQLVAPGPHDVAVITVRDIGVIRIELLPEIAPGTVANFEKLATDGFYDGTTFHRVIPGFMIQGGDPFSRNVDPRDDGKGGPGYHIEDEFSAFPHVRGVVSMANTGNPNSGGSQFFIVHQDARHLDGHYAAFGRVIESLEAVDAVTRVPIDKYGRFGPRDRPYPDPVVVESVRIQRAGAPVAAASRPDAPAAGGGSEPTPDRGSDS
jgi:peptidyl-prolyl cis-trans isomerase B (cyclophilin B)